MSNVGVDLQNELIKHYLKEAPKKLSSIILNSKLDISSPLASEVLEGMKGITTEDILAKISLYLKVGKMDQASLLLTSINADTLVSYCITNYTIIQQPSGTGQLNSFTPVDANMSPIAGMLRRFAPWVLLEIVVELTLATKLAGTQIIRLLKTDRTLRDTKYVVMKLLIVTSLLLMCYLEARIVRENVDADIVYELVQLYLTTITASSPPFFLTEEKGAIDLQYMSKWRLHHQKSFADRAVWLDALPPFADKIDSPRNSFPPPTPSVEQLGQFYTRKLQGLLGYIPTVLKRYISNTLFIHSEDAVVRIVQSVLNAIVSLHDGKLVGVQLICLALQNRYAKSPTLTTHSIVECVDILLIKDRLIFDYAKQYCRSVRL